MDLGVCQVLAFWYMLLRPIQEMLDELAYALEQLEDDESEDEDDAV